MTPFIPERVYGLIPGPIVIVTVIQAGSDFITRNSDDSVRESGTMLRRWNSECLSGKEKAQFVGGESI